MSPFASNVTSSLSQQQKSSSSSSSSSSSMLDNTIKSQRHEINLKGETTAAIELLNSPFLTTAEFYKNLLANAMLQQQQHQQEQQQFSTNKNYFFKSIKTTTTKNLEENLTKDIHKPNNCTWSNNSTLNSDVTKNNGKLHISPASTPTPPDTTNLANLTTNFESHRKLTPPISPTTRYTTNTTTCSSNPNNNNNNNNTSSSGNNNNNSKSEFLVNSLRQQCNTSAMPIGGVQGQNTTQGLVHWMSAVMAEHMTGQSHHDPTAVGMHAYMWNGNVDVSKYLSIIISFFFHLINLNVC